MPDGALPSWADIVRNVGVPGAVILAVLWAILKQWLVPGWAMKTWQDLYAKLKDESVFRLEELRKEKDYWRDAAMKTTDLAQRAVKTVEASGTPVAGKQP